MSKSGHPTAEHDLIKLLEFAASHDFFTWVELNEVYPDIKLEWYVSGTPDKKDILIEAGKDECKKPLHRISPNGLSIYLRRPLIIHRPSVSRLRHEAGDCIFGDVRVIDASFGRLRIDRRGVGR